MKQLKHVYDSLKEVEVYINSVEELLKMAYSFRVKEEDNVSVFKVVNGWVIKGTRGPTYFYNTVKKVWCFAPNIVNFNDSDTYDFIVENLYEAIKIAKEVSAIEKDY
jgi:hypothetical protein